MDWPAGVKPEALFSSDAARSMMNQTEPVWSLLNPNNPSGLKQQIDAKLAELGSNHPAGVEYVTIDERKGPVHVQEGASIEPHVHLIGPCLIETNATIRSHAYVREYTWMMSGSLLGHASESKHSLFPPRRKSTPLQLCWRLSAGFKRQSWCWRQTLEFTKRWKTHRNLAQRCSQRNRFAQVWGHPWR